MPDRDAQFTVPVVEHVRRPQRGRDGDPRYLVEVKRGKASGFLSEDLRVVDFGEAYVMSLSEADEAKRLLGKAATIWRRLT